MKLHLFIAKALAACSLAFRAVFDFIVFLDFASAAALRARLKSHSRARIVSVPVNGANPVREFVFERPAASRASFHWHRHTDHFLRMAINE